MAGLRCSFCGKTEAEVTSLIAGPGVYICDECVTLCTEVLAAAGRPPSPPIPEVPAWERMSDDEMLALVSRIASSRAQAEASLRQWVERLRGRGVTWNRIGTALGMTRQSAWERFADEQ